MGILLFQIGIFIIIYIAASMGNKARNTIALIISAYTLFAVFTSALMILQFLVIIISYVFSERFLPSEKKPHEFRNYQEERDEYTRKALMKLDAESEWKSYSATNRVDHRNKYRDSINKVEQKIKVEKAMAKIRASNIKNKPIDSTRQMTREELYSLLNKQMSIEPFVYGPSSLDKMVAWEKMKQAERDGK